MRPDPLSTKEFAYAGFWVRAAARIVDILVIVGIYNVFYLVDRFGASASLWPPSGFEPSTWPTAAQQRRSISGKGGWGICGGPWSESDSMCPAAPPAIPQRC